MTAAATVDFPLQEVPTTWTRRIAVVTPSARIPASMLFAAAALASPSASPSKAARVATVAGIAVTATGAGLTALALPDRGFEDTTGLVYATFGLPTLALGGALTTTGTCAQAVHVGADPLACGLSIGGLAATGLGTALWVPLSDDGTEPFPGWVLAGLGAEAFVAALVQGGVNRSTWRSVALLPRVDGAVGLTAVGRL